MTATILQSASDLLCIGDFYAAVETLGSRWPGVGVYPSRDGSDDVDYGRLLMACAVLSLNLGVARASRVHETVKDMLTRSVGLLSGPDALEPRLWLAVTYYWSGEYREAIVLSDAIVDEQTGDINVEVGALLTRSISEMALDEADRSLATLDRIAGLIEGANALMRGKYHLNRGIALRNIDKQAEALTEYETAAPLFEEVNSARYEAAVLNNAAGIYTDQGKYIKAHVAAERAVSLFRRIKDVAHEAKAWDQIAKVYIKERNYPKAVRPSRNAVELLSHSGYDGWLAESLTTLGIALAGNGYCESRAALDRAAEINGRLGNARWSKTSTRDLWESVQNGQSFARELNEGLRPIEKVVIEYTLDKHDGSITPTANELGVARQTLDKRIKSYFPDLLAKKKIRTRRKSLFRH